MCEYCGSHGACCRAGFGGDPAECGGLGGLLGGAHHSCRLAVDAVEEEPEEPEVEYTSYYYSSYFYYSVGLVQVEPDTGYFAPVFSDTDDYYYY
jgi:hypothetical protein